MARKINKDPQRIKIRKNVGRGSTGVRKVRYDGSKRRSSKSTKK